jgi:hypothetical protein
MTELAPPVKSVCDGVGAILGAADPGDSQNRMQAPTGRPGARLRRRATGRQIDPGNTTLRILAIFIVTSSAYGLGWPKDRGSTFVAAIEKA